MSIFRVHKNKTHPYTVIDNTSINDKRISAKAKGILLYLISKPDNWYVTLPNLVSSFTDGTRSIRTGIKELIKFGYISRSHYRSDNGQFVFYEYSVFEQPIKSTPLPECQNRTLDNRTLDNRTLDNSTLLSTDIKKVLITTTTHTPAVSSFLNPAVVESIDLNKKTTIISLLKGLNIKNHKKLFIEFPLDKILDYSTWLINRKSNMSNPTGFLITAMRENWIDYDNTPEEKNDPLWHAYCFPCRKGISYQAPKPISWNCPNCNKFFDKSKHEKF